MKSSGISKISLNQAFKPNSEKYNIAWFKLAEFVSRGEKERALGIYKLLTLSLNDQALIYQLEGDILFAFNDINAIDKYTKSANIYKQESRLIEAASIYEHILLLKEEIQYFINLLDIYKKIDFKPKIISTLKKALSFTLNENNTAYSLKYIEELEHLEPLFELVEYYQNCVFVLIKNNESKESILKFSQKVINSCFENSNFDLNKFLSKLEVINLEIYTEAIKLLNNKNDKQ